MTDKPTAPHPCICGSPLSQLMAARIAHSEACEAESVAWDAYNAVLEANGMDADTDSPEFKAWSAAGKVRMRALDAVLRAKGMT